MAGPPLVDQRTQALPQEGGSYNRFRLTVIRGVDTGTTFEAASEECAIGTSAANQVVLRDPLVSGHHCVVRAAAEGALLLDLGSTNGTRVGGLRIDAAFLTNGLTLEIGETTIRFETLGERISYELSESDRFGGLLGVSAAMRRIFAVVERVAPTDVPILLEGETGVGKSSLAELIHRTSGRGDKPLIVIDLTAMSTSDMEGALVGDKRQEGALAAGAGGSVLIEEIDQLPSALQVSLLEVIDKKRYVPFGKAEPVDLETRIIASTQSDLREAVNSRRFRPDLFYRLSSIRIRVPPLRERREDIPPLVETFYAASSSDELDPAPPAELIERLFWRPWPGNVRELRATVERALLIDEPALWHELGKEADPQARFEFDPKLSYRETKERLVGQFESWYVEELIRRHGGNLSRAARAARMDRTYLRELLRRHKIPLPSDKSNR